MTRLLFLIVSNSILRLEIIESILIGTEFTEQYQCFILIPGLHDTSLPVTPVVDLASNPGS